MSATQRQAPNTADRAQAANVWASLRDDWRTPELVLTEAFADTHEQPR